MVVVATVTAAMLVPLASARVPNACTLLTNAQASDALGVQLRWKQPQGDRLTRVCTFHGRPYSSAAMGQHARVILMVWETTRAKFQSFYRRLMPVRGVGELAYFSEGVVNELHVWTDEDAEAFTGYFDDLSAEEKVATLRKFTMAINQQLMKADTERMPF